MADLDDFFAKKDRKKKDKNVKKYSTADEVVRKLEDTSKKADKPPKKERNPPLEGDDSESAENDQDEWNDEEKNQIDLTGLKIGHLSIHESAEGNTDGGVDQPSTGDESGVEPERKAGPWKKVAAEAPPPVVEPERPVVEQAKPATAGGYVPPHLRNQPVHAPSRLKSKAAPDIHSEEFFPTLSGGKGGDTRRSRNEGTFEEVRPNKSSSYRHAEQTKLSNAQGPKLNLGNRFGTLSNDNNS